MKNDQKTVGTGSPDVPIANRSGWKPLRETRPEQSPKLTPRLSPGHRILGTYFLVFYLVPLLGNRALSHQVETIYRVEELSLVALFSLVAVPVIAYLMTQSARGDRSRPQGRVATIGAALHRRYQKIRLVFSGLLAFGAYWFFTTGMNTFRYTSESIADSSSSLLLVVNVGVVVATLDVFYNVFVATDRPEASTVQWRLGNLLMAITLLLAANGTATMLLALIACTLAIWPPALRRLMLVEPGATFSRRIAQFSVASVGIAALAAMAWLSGETIKGASRTPGQDASFLLPVETAADLTSDMNWVENYLLYLVSALSSHYYSHLYTFSAPRDVLGDGMSVPIARPLTNALYRVDYLIGGAFGFERPEVGSFSRLNYLLLTIDPSSLRQGSSPGVIAAFTYIAVFPFNILLAAIYCALVVKLIDTIFSGHQTKRLTAAGAFVALMFLMSLFQSPIDFLLLFDETTITVVVLCILALVATSGRVGVGQRSSGSRRSVGSERVLVLQPHAAQFAPPVHRRTV